MDFFTFTVITRPQSYQLDSIADYELVSLNNNMNYFIGFAKVTIPNT